MRHLLYLHRLALGGIDLSGCNLSMETRADLGWLREYMEGQRLRNLAMALWGGGEAKK